MSPWPWRMGAAAPNPLSSCSQGVSAGAYGKWVQVQLNGTKKRCDTVLYRRDLTARMIVEYKGAWNRNHPKGFRPDYPLQHGAESGLSDCQQRASALLLSHRLRAQQLYFSAGYTRVSKLIGGATNSPLASLISSHHIPCVICGRWCSRCPHPSRMVHDEGGNVVFPAVGKDNEAGIIICSFHTVGIAVGKRRSCVLPRFWLATYLSVCWHRFQYLSWSATKVFQLLVGEQLFFISRSPVVGP